MASIQDGLQGLGDGFKNVFLAGIGALAITGEKGKELVDVLVQRGELTIEQGKEINAELTRKAAEATQGVRDTALEARMKAMSPEERDAFAAKVAELAAEQNAKAAEVVVESVETTEPAEEAAAPTIEVEVIVEEAPEAQAASAPAPDAPDAAADAADAPAAAAADAPAQA